MKVIAVYGSLKKGKYNHHILEDQEFLGKTQVTGTLYSLGAYPALCERGNTKYVAEVYKVTDEVYNSIRGMELGAGYKEVTKEVNGDDVVVYYAGMFLDVMCKDNHKEIKDY